MSTSIIESIEGNVGQARESSGSRRAVPGVPGASFHRGPVELTVDASVLVQAAVALAQCFNHTPVARCVIAAVVYSNDTDT